MGRPRFRHERIALRAVVISDWIASYEDPIAVSEGEPLCLTGAKDIWDGHLWLWAANPAGREGWVPDTLPRPAPEGGHVAARDYSAVELTCTTGERLGVLEESHGWLLCRNDAGRAGWVPARNLRRLPT